METRARKRLMSAAHRYSFSRLALNYYSFCELMPEAGDASGQIRELGKRIGDLIGAYYRGEDRIAELDELRSGAARDMEILTSYGDNLSIYEYVLMRVERRFVKIDPPDETPEEFADRLLKQLQSSEDSVILDSRLRSIVGQMPIRYTRQKFYNEVKDRLTAYIGADQTGLKSLFYMLRTSASLCVPEGREEAQPELERAYRTLCATDYKNLDADGFNTARACFNQAAEIFRKKVDICLSYENLLNDLYVLFLCRDEAMADVWEDGVFKQILLGVGEHFEKSDMTGIDAELTEQLQNLEGIQESAVERIRFQEEETDPDLVKMEKLLSASAFAPLDNAASGAQVPADREWIEEKSREFCEELDGLFKEMQRPVMRAVMATVLAQLPMVFKSVSDLKDYVLGGLAACTDYAEREASMACLQRELFEEPEG